MSSPSSNFLPKKLSKIHFALYPKQMMALHSSATEMLFGGASEGGKSFYGRVMTSIYSAVVPNLQTRIYRKHYKDVVGNHMDGVSSYPELLRPWVNDKFVKITENEVQFDNGALIQLAGMLHKKDLEKHQGLEKQILWIDESTQILAEYVKGLRAWVRMPKDMKDALPKLLRPLFPNLTEQQLREKLPLILYTANPIGVSVGYFRRGFVQGFESGELHEAPENDGGFLRTYISSRIEDNPSADPVAQRKRLAALGENTAEALIKGLWDTPTGDFFKDYNDDIHAVPDFTPPNHWFKYRTFDWGSADPFAVYWIAVSDGERFNDEFGRSRWFPRGSIIAYREWYGCDEEEPSKGIHMRNEDIAKGIVARTQETMCGLTFSDNYPFADRGHTKNHQKYTMADDFRDNGCPLTLGNTARVYGWKQMRSRMQGIEGVPLAYITHSCIYLRQYLPALGYSENNSEDAAEDGEATHSCDAWRLAHTVRPLVKDEIKERPKDYQSAKAWPTPTQLISMINKSKQKSTYVTRK